MTSFPIRACIFINSWRRNDEKSIPSPRVSYGELLKMENEETSEDKAIRSENCFYLLAYHVFGLDAFLRTPLICFICNNLKKKSFFTRSVREKFLLSSYAFLRL